MQDKKSRKKLSPDDLKQWGHVIGELEWLLFKLCGMIGTALYGYQIILTTIAHLH